ncbi:transcription initiation factor TFIIE subunit alpha [Nematocida sp. ERTm5]|nr:transcription initiation factor TFIIE subunit alpha [Nematocida sp. ERTm5]
MSSASSPMEELIKRITRMFYEPHHVVIMDIMLNHMVLSEDDLADKMKLLPREFNRLAVKLKDDKILSSVTTNDIKPDGMQTTKTTFSLNFAQIINIVKYKIFVMTKQLETKMRDKETKIMYHCEKCDISHSLLDVQSLLDSTTFTFRCSDCGSELKEKKESSENEKMHASDIFKKLMEEVNCIIILLKEIESLGIESAPRKSSATQEDADTPEEQGREYSNNKLLFAEEETEEKISIPEIEIESEKEAAVISNEQEEEANDSTSKNSEIGMETVEVEGVPKLYKDITEEDKERMSESEYERYFEIYEKNN